MTHAGTYAVRQMGDRDDRRGDNQGNDDKGVRGRDDHDRDDSDRGTYAIGLWGDLPYSDAQALTGVPNMIEDMNLQDLGFTAHDGDLKAGNSTAGSVTTTDCSNPLYLRRCTISTRCGLLRC